jgi:two-component system chemotaxis response regulator CheY
MFLKLAIEMLSEYKTFSALDAATGLKSYQQNKPDITFLDISLPDKSGYTILEEILTINPKAFVVMLTASNLKSDVEVAMKKGAKGYVIKPFSRKKLKDIIEQYIKS